MSETLPQRMRAAAHVLSDAASRLHPNDAPGWYLSTWSSDSLTRAADRWEAEDREFAERAEWVEQLAEAIAEGRGYQAYLNSLNAVDQLECRNLARHIIAKGWRKGEPHA